MTPEDRLNLIRAKIERANAHFNELNARVAAFLSTNPYEVVGKQDANTRQFTYYVSRVEPVPDVLALVAGDVIQNLRSSLDHLVTHLYQAANNGKYPPSHLYFPTIPARCSTKPAPPRNFMVFGKPQLTQ